jgi:hypothetical protein
LVFAAGDPDRADARRGVSLGVPPGRRLDRLDYARVSTDAQDLSNQVAHLKAAGCGRIFREKISGATAERPQLDSLHKGKK